MPDWLKKKEWEGCALPWQGCAGLTCMKASAFSIDMTSQLPRPLPVIQDGLSYALKDLADVIMNDCCLGTGLDSDIHGGKETFCGASGRHEAAHSSVVGPSCWSASAFKRVNTCQKATQACLPAQSGETLPRLEASPGCLRYAET